MRTRHAIWIVMPLLGLVLAAAACDDGSEPSPTLPPAPTGSGALAPEVGGVYAARLYLVETGIDGKTGDLTEPRSCGEIGEDGSGRFCIHEDFSTFAPGLVILRIADKDEPQGEVWEMRLSLEDSAWQVTGVTPFGVGE